MKKNHTYPRVRYMVITFTILSLCFMTACSGAPKAQQDREIKEYLSKQYHGEFVIELKQDEGQPYYEAYPTTYPDVIFRVENNELYDSSPFALPLKDDYAQQLFEKSAERLDLSILEMDCQQSNPPFQYSLLNATVQYPDYQSIEDTAKKVAELVNICRESNAFFPKQSYLTVLPSFTENTDFPGCMIALSSGEWGMNSGESLFEIESSEVTVNKVIEKLKYCHIYSFYNYTMPTQEAPFPSEDIEKYIQLSTGAMGTAENGAIIGYSYVNMADPNEDIEPFSIRSQSLLTIGGAYQILSTEGMVTQIGENFFTTSGNEMTATFTVAFEEGHPIYSWSCVDIQGNALPDWENPGDTSISLSLIEEITGKNLLPVSLDEYRKNIEGLRKDPNPLGTSQKISSVEFSVRSAETVERLEDSFYYYEPKKGYVFLVLRLTATNHGKKTVYLFDPLPNPGDSYYQGVVSNSESHVYAMVKQVVGGIGTIDFSVKSGESIEENLVFQIPSDKATALTELIFTIQNDSGDSAAFFVE